MSIAARTAVEVKERKDRVDDALNASSAAVEEGVVAGAMGGMDFQDMRSAQVQTNEPRCEGTGVF